MTCRHLTRSGTQCKARTGLLEVACKQHATDDDRAVAGLLNEAYESGRRAGENSARWRVEMEAQATIREERAKLAALPCAHYRTHDYRGQLVAVTGGYTYRWTGTPDLAVGDTVTVPGTWVNGAPRDVEVVAVMSDYQGSITDIIGRVEGAA